MTRLVTLLLALLISTPVFGAVAEDAVSTFTGTGIDTFQWNHTVSGSTRVLYCGAAVNGTGAPTSAIYNSVAMTEIGSISAESNGYIRVYRLIAPATGTNQVSFTLSAAGDMSIGCISVTGAHQTTPEGTIDTDAHTLTPLEATVTVSTGGMGLSFAYDLQVGSCGSHTATDTEIYDLCDGTTPVIGAMGSKTSNTGSVTMGWTGMAGNYAGIVVVPVEQASAPSAAGQSRIMVVE